MRLGTRHWDSEGEPHYAIKKSLVEFGVVAAVFRRCALKNCSWQMVLSCEWERRGSDHRGVLVPNYLL